jgi:hypothetical protein
VLGVGIPIGLEDAVADEQFADAPVEVEVWTPAQASILPLLTMSSRLSGPSPTAAEWMPKQYLQPLLVVLRGPWPQVWLPGGKVFSLAGMLFPWPVVNKVDFLKAYILLKLRLKSIRKQFCLCLFTVSV